MKTLSSSTRRRVFSLSFIFVIIVVVLPASVLWFLAVGWKYGRSQLRRRASYCRDRESSAGREGEHGVVLLDVSWLMFRGSWFVVYIPPSTLG